MMRARLLWLADEEHLFVVTMHHIVADGWSMAVFASDLSAWYAASSQGDMALLAPLPVQYADYAVWQREWLQGEELERQLGYWREQLAGAPTVLELPADKPRPTVLGSPGAFYTFELSAELGSRLRELSQQESATLFMTLLAGFSVLLSRYTGQKDLLIGAPIANRNREEIAGLIGFFANTLVLRERFEEGTTFHSIINQTKEVCLGAYAHQDLPFEKLVEELQPERDLSRSPLFQVLFALQNAPQEALRLEGLSLRPVRVETEIAKFDLSLLISDTAHGLKGVLEYSTDLFEQETIERLLGHFRILLEAMVAEPQRVITELPLLSAAERRQLLVEWNDTKDEERLNSCIHQLFEEQVEKTPEATALVFANERLSYAELNGRANQLAHYLKQQGVGREVLVGVMLERSVEMVVGLLAVLKAGGAYVPLDSEYPAERLAFMIADARLRVLLTTDRLSRVVPATEAEAICLDRESEQLGVESRKNLTINTQPHELAYVMYTSGSTGIPKGVSVPHRAVIRLVKETDYVRFAADEVFLQLAPISFDASTLELWGSLLNGATLVLMPPQTPSLEELGAALRHYGVTTLWLTAGLFHLMVDERLDDLRGVRQLLAGGDVLSTAHVQRFLAAADDGVLINGYGPTENTTFSCTHRMAAGWELKGSSVPIGRPIRNTQVYVLDERLEPVPIGVAGELYLGGAGLARDYLRWPELTAEKFVPHPYSAEPGARLYRTGDLVRWLDAGEIEFLGRIDQQVKIRGFRIELGEIEAALQSVAEVNEAVVIVREDTPGEKLLVAYVVPQDGNLTINELRAHLKRRLPEYMVPPVFIYLDELPLTTNGKVDRKALPAPETDFSSAGSYVAPRTPVEEMLCGIWSEVLGVRVIGVTDNFFWLGGHSLRATLIVIRIHETFGVEIPLRTIFEAPTVPELAAAVEAAMNAERGYTAPPITSVARRGPLPLSFAQQRLWFLDRLNPETDAYNIAIAYHLKGSLNVAVLEHSLNQVVARHEVLRTTISLVAGEPVQIITPELELKLEVADLRALAGVQQEMAVVEELEREAQRPFDLSTGPVLRARLLRLSDEAYVFVVTVHHIAADGWSMDVFSRELSLLYDAEVSGTTAALPELPVQYADYAVWQGEWLKGEILEEQLSYWREQLHNANVVVELPADKKRPRVAAGLSEIEPFAIDSEVLAGLRNLALEERTTLFMTLWAAFSVLLSRYTGQQDLLIGAPVANRERPEVAGLIGLFTNTLVLRARVTGDESFRSLLARAREICLGAYSYQDLPFETLVEALQPNRDVSRSPLVQVTFAVQSGAVGALGLTGIDAKPFPVAPRTTKFELVVVLGEKEGGLAGAIQYNTELFEAATVAQLASHLATLLEHVLENPDRPVSELPLLTTAETKTALVQWNQTEAEYPAGRCAHQLFEMQVERTPDNVALISSDRQITYSDLNRDAGQLARYLSTRGVGPETTVAVCLERSVESAIGILGVLKAGGVCLLLDPVADQDQFAAVLAEARPHLLLVQGRLLEDSLQWRERLVRIDSQWEEIARAGQWTNDSAVLPENLAYLSCERSNDGEVKLVGHTHQALVHGLHWMQRALRLSELDHVLPGFGVWELLLSLSCGSAALVAEAGQQHASVVQCSPSLLENLLDEPHNLSAIKHVICSGEPLLPDLVERFAKRLPTADLHHLHGSGELSVGAGHWSFNSGDENPLIPAIRPITNVQLYVLDGSMQPVPVGVEGTLYAGGINLARGYQNRSDLTAEMFVPDPFAGQPGSRLFKTNERCKYRRDGAIVPLGPQVRSRGYQVDLLDVERELRQCPLISRAAVVAVKQAQRDQQLVAYIVPASGEAANDLIAEVRAFMRERLPDYALPSAYLSLTALPLRHDGTLDRDALPLYETERPETTSAFVPSTETEQKIAELWRVCLAVEHVGINDNFFDLGGHSLLLAQLHPRLNELFHTDVTVIDLFRYSTVRTLAEYIDKRAVRTAVVATPDEVPSELPEVPEVTTPLRVAAGVPANAIAIIGMAARFPGCRDVEEFWQKLKDGEELISSFSDEELLAAGVSEKWLQDPNYVKAAAFLEQADCFDAQFFGMQPREAEVMDPQQRVFLECAWSALEAAGIDAESYRGRIGVYGGVGHNTYLSNVFGNADVMRTVDGFQVILANDKDFLPMRVSYKLNLRGPSIAVQTACSTSLVAVHLALQALLNDECDVALCGGVTLRAAKGGYLYQEGGIVSPDGHCRSFDAEAAGTVPGNGAGVVVLKRLRDALDDRDRIDAVIIGSAINNDGSLKVGFTAPSIDGQADVIERAQINAGVTPDTISYIEAHGTGTELGDPIEVAALNQAFRTATQKKAYCALGSVKSNLGHLDAAAGVSGLIKTVLALKHKELPPSLHYQTPNPKIDFANSPFYVNNKLKKWETNGLPRRAGVSSFGMGGTNAHLVVQEAPETTAPMAVDEPQLILLTAKTSTALQTATTNLVQHLEQHPELNLRDAAYTLQAGRQHFGHRRMVVAHDRNDVIETLGSVDGKRVGTSQVDQRERPCVFVFPGQGSQYVNMGAGLYKSAPTFRRHVDECCELLKRYTGTDLRERLYPRSEDPDDAARWFDQTVNAQPALFVIEYALTQFLAELGVKPKAMLGHSVGEYVAACVAGVFSLETALLLVARRAELMQSLPAGRMLFVPLPEREIESLLNDELSLAAVNGVDFCVVSGTTGAVEELDRELTERDVECQPLHTSHAFHSAMVEPIVKPFVEFVKKVELKPPRIPFVSNVTGAWITVSQAVDPNYWGDHVRRTVRFSDGLQSLLTDPRTLVLEVGPGTTLSGLIRKHPSHTPEQKALALLRHPKDKREDFEVFLQALGEAWLARQHVDWQALHSDKEPRKIALPTYPFERKRYWIDPPAKVAAQVASVSAEVVARANGDGSELVAKPLAMSATAQQVIVPSSITLEPQIVTRVERPANGNGHGTMPTPKHQIIAQQLKIGSEQIKLMALQLEVLRNARRPKAQ
jgi:amino acid adenylation domain-containing protein